MNTALIIFVKNPVLGRCKTRLALTVGDEKALEVYEKLLQQTRISCEAVPTPRYLYYDSFINKEDAWSDKLFHKKIQSSGDLGEKMKSAFSEILDKHRKVIIIGSDCPELKADDLKSAFRALDEFDCCIGPSLDGGYYLLGMKSLEESLFEDIDWSTASVYTQTVQKMQKAGLSYTALRTLSDLDDENDLMRFPQFL